MKKALKLLMYGVAGIVVLSVVIGLMADSEEVAEETQPAAVEEETTEDEQESQQEAEEEEEKEVEETNKPTINKSEFDEIQNGMTYDEVVEIIGGEGEVMSESGSEGEQFHTIMYTWEGEGDLGANANATFQDGEMINKAQFGLK